MSIHIHFRIGFISPYKERYIAGSSTSFDERIVYSPDKDSVCSKRGTTEIL